MTVPTPPAVSDTMREAVARSLGDALVQVGLGRSIGVLAFEEVVAFLVRPSGSIASEIDRLTGDLKAAHETNRDLHRRMQAVEGPLQSRIAHLNQGVEFWKKQRMRKGVRAVAETRRAEAAEAETARLRAENAEARAEGRRQGLEEAAAYFVAQISTAYGYHRLPADEVAQHLRSLANTPTETQKPETGESAR